jgi:hypothetical protein
MTYTENEIKEAFELAKHQNPYLNWRFIKESFRVALKEVSKQDNTIQVFIPFKSKFPSNEIKGVFHQMRKRTPT